MNVRELGEYIRKERNGSRLSLKSFSSLAGVSIPYLSQVERGLRRPSADVLHGIAKALRISAEQLYVKAGILDERPAADVESVIMSDPVITERQKQALIQIYEAFREETSRVLPEGPGPRSTAKPAGRTRKSTARPSVSKPASPATARTTRAGTSRSGSRKTGPKATNHPRREV